MTLDLSGPVTSVCRGEGAPNCAIHGPEAQPTHVPPSHGEHIWICSHLKHIFSTFAVVTQQQVPHGKNTTTPTTTTPGGRLMFCSIEQIKCCINLPLNPNRFPNIGSIFIFMRHNTCVTHVWITAEKSCGEFSTHAHGCRNLVLFCDDSVVSFNIFQTHLGVEESSHRSCFQKRI